MVEEIPQAASRLRSSPSRDTPREMIMFDDNFVPAAPTAQVSRRTGILRLGVMCVLVLAAAGCGGSGIGIWVDNGATDPIVVILEGQEEVTIAPGEFAKLGCEPGERRLQVKSGGKVLF